ncbi:MAG: class I SAM-dependent methyltransferase [Proteobacteria bacterium]|nr:class I SAM-dependent methyltransferase [Pseudomonadota bacterium]
MNKTIATPVLAFLLVACGQHNHDDAVHASESHDIDPAIYTSAIANPARNEADRARDAGRKPAEVMEFFGIAPGMKVFDMFSGGGYYAEILAHVVGNTGLIVAHTNETSVGYVGDEFNARYADDRLPIVEILMAENNELELDAEQFDAIILVLGYHDIYWVAPQQGWPKINVTQLLAELHGSLKPGGILGIIDHYAETGAPRETGGTLHRIDPSIVIAELEAAGFELEAKSDLLRNMDDDHSKGVFDPTIRGKTDRFTLRFRKRG